MVEKEEHYQYRMVSPAEIVRDGMNLLGSVFDSIMIGDKKGKLGMRVRNQQMIEAFLTRQGMNGWELVCSLDYEGLPYHGSLIFRKKIVVEIEEEVSDTPANFTKDVKRGNLYKRFENETGKNAVWHNKETKSFKDWEKGIQYETNMEKGEN